MISSPQTTDESRVTPDDHFAIWAKSIAHGWYTSGDAVAILSEAADALAEAFKPERIGDRYPVDFCVKRTFGGQTWDMTAVAAAVLVGRMDDREGREWLDDQDDDEPLAAWVRRRMGAGETWSVIARRGRGIERAQYAGQVEAI